MRSTLIRKIPLQQGERPEDLKGKTPQQLLGMMWQLALNAWSFKENLNVEPRLQRHVVVLKRRRG